VITLYGLPGSDDMETHVQDAVDIAWFATDEDLIVVEEWSCDSDEGLWSREAFWKVPVDPDDDWPPTARHFHRTETR
jgi:hypothetical protein